MTTDQKWRRVICWLRRTFPSHLPIRVRSVPDKRLGKAHGLCILNTDVGEIGRFEILIRRHTSFALRLDTLLHEWAHALTWFGAQSEEEHSEEWGLAFGRIYKAFCEWNYGQSITKPDE